MLSLKGLLCVAALAVLIQPAAWAANGAATGDVPGSAPTGTSRVNPPAPGACVKAAKPALSDQERARRKALRAERVALGVQPPQRTAEQKAAHRARMATCRTP